MPVPSTVADQEAILQLNSLFQKQQAAFLAAPYPSAAERIDRLQRIPMMLRTFRSDMLDALNEDFGGHARPQGDTIEIFTADERAKYAIKHLKRWMRPIKRTVNPITMGRSKAYLKYHPKGVIGNIVPWNFPFDIGLGPTIDILAAGNSAIIKPSELSPASGALLQRMIEATFDETEVAVVNGGIELAKTFSSLPWDHLVFTGSAEIGSKVMQAAAVNLVPVTLELGGKNPVIFHESAVTPAHIHEMAGVKAVKRGQMCVGADYCFVPRTQMDSFLDTLTTFFQTHFADAENGAQHATGIISDRHMERLYTLVEEAREAGAKVIQTGPLPEAGSRHMPFFIVVDPPKDMRLMQEEIFGPILPILSYDSIEEILTHVNTGGAPLALYIYAKDPHFISQLTHQTRSGGVAINILALQAGQPSLPFGGVGASGMGMHHGLEGFREFSNPKGYFEKGGGSTIGWINPPYDQKTDYLIEEVGYGSRGKQALFALKRLPKLIAASFGGR